MDDKKNIYILYIRSILEQSCIVWHIRLTQKDANDLERVQKAAVKIIIGKDFESYEDALLQVDLPPLYERRKELCLSFARKCLQNEKTKDMFQVKSKNHAMNMRNTEEFQVEFANTDRLKNSAIPYMQRLLNAEQSEQSNKVINKSRIRNPG